jgi:beta-N-acetylhexosaminidase
MISIPTTLEGKIGQMLMIGFHGTQAPDYVLDWLREGRIGGVILFARNIANPQQVAAMTSALHAAAKVPLLIAVDQEGGAVARMRSAEGFTESPGAMALGAADDEALAERVAGTLAHELRAVGINWNLAPVVDLTHDIRNASVGTRSLGSDHARVAALAAAQIRGYQNAGVAASAKHFPGIGHTPIDTHLALPEIDSPVDDLLRDDLIPFGAAVEAGTATVMISHVKFNALDRNHPATLSPSVIGGLLRDRLGFAGVTCTDCMEMKAVGDHYGPSESALLAALAGQDLILFSHSFNPDQNLYTRVYDDLLAAARSGRLPLARIDEANERIAALKGRYAITQPPSPGLIRSEDHLAVMNEAARAGIVLLRGGEFLPLRPDDVNRMALIEFASYLDSPAMDRGDSTQFAALMAAALPGLPTVALKSTENPALLLEHAHRLAAESDTLILATRSAHLNPVQIDLAINLIQRAKRVFLLCLRNPFDVAALPEADAAICTCGDSEPSLHAAVAALLGHFVPSGKLPVQLERT